MLLSLHAPVHCRETRCGVVSGVLLDLSRRRVAYILVQQPGLLAPERLLPPSVVSAVDAHALRLCIDDGDLIEYDALSEPVSAYHLEPEPPTWTETHILRHGARVVATDGPIGRVGALALAPDWTIESLVLRQGHLWGARTIAIPMTQVADMNESTITLMITRHDVQAHSTDMPL